MHSHTYDYNDEDFDRFVLGSNGGPSPGGFILLVVIVIGAPIGGSNEDMGFGS